MKKTYKFEEDNEKYAISSDETETYIITKDNLKVDGTKFYEIFFSKYSVGDKIELIKGSSFDTSNKLSIAVYETVSKLINEIIEKIDNEK